MTLSLNDLHPAPGSRRTRRRVGRGLGSGRGTTAGRGTKGQKARSGGRIPGYFEGGQNSLVHRMPTKRGVHFRSVPRERPATVNLRQLNRFAANETVDLDALIRVGLVERNAKRVKILADGELTHPLIVHAHQFSAQAKAKIEAAGGQAVVVAAPAAEEQ